MVPASGRNRAPLSEQLRTEAFRFDFFQAVRVMHRMAAEDAEQDDAAPQFPVGEDYAPKQEVVRFRALPSRSFPSGSVCEIRRPQPRRRRETATGPTEMVTAFMGLTGPNGVLPQHYTTLLIERVRDKDFSLADFFDLFNHRVISLFYRAWEKYRFAIAYERSQTTGPKDKEDLFTSCLYSLVGLGTGKLRGRMEFDDEAFLYYAGHFAHFPRSAVSLELMLSDYFELPVQVRQFQGQWLYLSPDDQSSLPAPMWPGGLNTRLGTDVIVGERVWDVQGKFRVRFGPLTYREFCRFVPSGDALRPLCQMIRTYVGSQFDFDVQPVLAAAEVPWCQLGGDGDRPFGGSLEQTTTDGRARLGWNTWIRSGDFKHDVSDAIFSLEGLPWTTRASGP